MAGLLGFGGAVMQAAAFQSQGQAAADAANFNAETQRMQGVAAERATRAQSSRQIRSIRAGISKSGVTFEGTPTMVLADSAANAEIDALNARWTAQRKEAITRFEGAAARRAGSLQAGAALISGAARLI
jgi:hypothetical protein